MNTTLQHLSKHLLMFGLLAGLNACGGGSTPENNSDSDLLLPAIESNTDQSRTLAAQTLSASADLLFFDNFNYEVNRYGDNVSTFSAHGWSDAKATNLTGGHAGYLYTVDQVPGYSGFFPGQNSSHVLAIEARPSTMDSTTDFYLTFIEAHCCPATGSDITGDWCFDFVVSNDKDRVEVFITAWNRTTEEDSAIAIIDAVIEIASHGLGLDNNLTAETVTCLDHDVVTIDNQVFTAQTV
jgi:hypothetical protein